MYWSNKKIFKLHMGTGDLDLKSVMNKTKHFKPATNWKRNPGFELLNFRFALHGHSNQCCIRNYSTVLRIPIQHVQVNEVMCILSHMHLEVQLKCLQTRFLWSEFMCDVQVQDFLSGAGAWGAIKMAYIFPTTILSKTIFTCIVIYLCMYVIW